MAFCTCPRGYLWYDGPNGLKCFAHERDRYEGVGRWQDPARPPVPCEEDMLRMNGTNGQGFALPSGGGALTRRVASAFTIPAPTTSKGSSNPSSATGILGDLGKLGLDYLRSRLIPTGTTPPGPGLTNTVPAAGCPEGQFGFPPACFDLQPGGGTQGGGMVVFSGEAVMGRYGAALQPSVSSRQVRRCPRGAVLGNDGLCYNRRDLNRRDRWWIPARKPLLTGGDLNAISKAARAANKMKTQQKRLQKLGLLPRPTSKGRGARQLRIGSGQPSVLQIQQE